MAAAPFPSHRLERGTEAPIPLGKLVARPQPAIACTRLPSRILPTWRLLRKWHACCNAAFMLDALTDTDRTFLFLLTAIGLGACFVWAFWELEQMRE